MPLAGYVSFIFIYTMFSVVNALGGADLLLPGQACPGIGQEMQLRGAVTGCAAVTRTTHPACYH